MSERPQAEPSPGAWHVQLSKLLMILFLVAVAATGGLLVTLLIGLSESPPNGRPGPNGLPPPPDMRIIEAITFMTGVFVLAWLAVLVVFVRDQILQRLRERPPTGGVGRDELAGLLGELRSQLAADQAALGDRLSERLAEATGEYGERRETDGYLSGMRMATGDEPSAGNVRALRRTPPQR